MDRKNKPSTIPISPSLPQPNVDVSGLTVRATLPTQDAVTINLFGASVTSWTTASGQEQLFLSTAAKLDGSKAIRGGIPIVFPVFGPPPKEHATGKLPQHGFARSVLWEFLGKNTSESRSGKKGGDEEVKLDFGLSSSMLPEEMKSKWPYEFGLVYSVTLGKGMLETGLYVQNKGGEAFEFQALFHNYMKIEDISNISIHGLESAPFFDKITSSPSDASAASDPLTLSSSTDRVYSSLDPSTAITVHEAGKPKFSFVRREFTDCTVWNPWQKGAEGMGDFEPKSGYKNMVCVEPGAVKGWIKLETDDTWEGVQVIRAE